MTPEEELERGHRAARLLSDDLLQEAFSTIEHKLRDAWETSPARDVEGRETLWLSVKLLKQVRAHLESVVTTGKLAEIGLARRGVSVSS